MNMLILKIVGFVVLGTLIGATLGFDAWIGFAIGSAFADICQPFAIYRTPGQ